MRLGKTVEHMNGRMTNSTACIGAWRGVCIREENKRSPPVEKFNPHLSTEKPYGADASRPLKLVP